VTEEAGIVDRDGRGLGVIAGDFDDDGKIDVFVTNDTTANYFFHNNGGCRFTEEGLSSGLATSAGGSSLAGMGIACGDFDGDGRLDLAVTNFFKQSTTLYHNHGYGVFSDRSTEAGLAAVTRLVLGFGLAALDANNDGRLDLVQANGHVFASSPTIPSAMRAQLFLGQGQGKLVDVSDRAGPPWKVQRFGRGLAVGDFDNDGRTDVIMVSQNAPLALFHNQSVSQNHFLVLALEGTTSNRDAVGAKVAMTAGGKTQAVARFGGGSYLSASDPRLHFGLGPALKADRVEVTWPSGRRDCYLDLAADTGYRLREGDPAPRPLAGFAPAAH
jgi:enediyne biosynthesis protein E4